MTILELIDKGGAVVWVLLAYSLLALTLISERLLHFLTMKPVPQGFDHDLVSAVEQGALDNLLDRMRNPEGRLLRGIWHSAREGIDDLERVASRLGSEELQGMERGFRTLGILGNTAPLLGLLGTIIGMVKAFMVIEQAGGRVDAQALAGGIWEAMLTTGVGLAVAIPVLLILHTLEGMADRRAQSMRSSASLLLERLPHSEHHLDNSPAAVHRGEYSDAV